MCTFYSCYSNFTNKTNVRFSTFRNLDPLTETYGLSFYMQYLAHWPEYFQVAESPAGEIMGYGKFPYLRVILFYFISSLLLTHNGILLRMITETDLNLM